SGHTVNGTRSSRSRATRSGSSRARLPWSIRSMPSTSSASRTYSGPPSPPPQVPGCLAAEVAQEADDEVGGEPGRPRLLQRGPQPAEDHLERHAVAQVRLRVAEDLRAADPGGSGARQVGRGQVAEVLLGPQYRQVGVVDVEEGLQVGEVGVS